MLNPQSYLVSQQDNIVSFWIFELLPNPLFQNIVANLLIFVQAWIINHIVAKHKLSKETTLFCGLFYIVFISLIPSNNILSPVLIANTFVLFGITELFKTYKVTDATALIFNVGFLLGLASLIYNPFYILVLFGIISLIVIRSFKMVELMQYMIGFLMSFFLLHVYKYWIGLPIFDYQYWTFYFFKIPIFDFEIISSLTISLVFIAICILASFINYGFFLSKKSIQAQKNIDILFWLLLFCIVTTFINVPNDMLHFIVPGLYLSFFLGILVSDTKNKILYELIHVLVFIFIIISQLGLIP